MEHWEQRLKDLETRLAEWSRRFRAELLRVRKDRGLDGWRARLRRPRPDDVQEATAEARRRAGVEELAELSGFLDVLCDHYPTVLPQERATIRARVGMSESAFDLLWSYIEMMPERVRTSGEPAMLKRALGAIAIDDLRADLRHFDDVLRRLVVAAAGRGIDWRPILREAAAVSNPGAGGGGACLRERLEGFERSSAFREQVAEELRGAARVAGSPVRR